MSEKNRHMRISGVAILLALLIGGQGKASEETQEQTITVVGLDEDGRSLAKEIPLPAFRKTMRALVMAVNDSAQPILAKRSASVPINQIWALRNLAIGTTIGASIGLGPIWSIAGAARLRLVFSNSKNPVYPD